MFLEDEDWDDEHEDQPLSKTVTSIQQATSVANVKVKAHPVAIAIAETSGLAFRERERKREEINDSQTCLKMTLCITDQRGRM